MNQAQALQALSDYHSFDSIHFLNAYDLELSPTTAGEWLIDEHHVPEEDAFQWAFDWVTLMESQDNTRPPNYY